MSAKVRQTNGLQRGENPGWLPSITGRPAIDSRPASGPANRITTTDPSAVFTLAELLHSDSCPRLVDNKAKIVLDKQTNIGHTVKHDIDTMDTLLSKR